MVLTLYKLDASPPARAVCMTIQALKLKDVEYVDVNVLEGDNYKEEYLQMNPHHTIPLLIDDEFVVWDSHAISTYLVTKYSLDSTLYPTDPKKRAIIDQRLHFDSGILFPALRGTVEPVIFKGEKTYKPENLEKVKNAYNLTEAIITSNWMAGDVITLADISCVSSISSLNEIIPIDPTAYPNMASWLKRCSEQDFYKEGNAPGLNQFQMLLQSKLA